MNNLNRIYERLKQSNPNVDDRLLKQKAWVMRDKMIYENTSFSNSSAAGAAGGGGLRRRNKDFDKIIALHWVITWADVASDTWKIVVYNYTSGVLSPIIDTGLIYDGGNQWYLGDDENAISESGHSILFENSSDGKFKIFFVNSNGQVLGIKDLDTREDFQYTENAMIYLGELDGVSTCYHFDGANVRTHTFPDVDIKDIEVDDSSDDDVFADGSIVIEAPNNEKWFISRPDGSLVEITNDMLGQDSSQMSYNSDFLLKIDIDQHIKTISQDGTLKGTFDLTPFSCTSINESTFYGDNCAYVSMNTDQGYRVLVSFDGDSNQFVSFTFSDSLADVQFAAFEINWATPEPSYGKSLIYYSSTTSTGGSNGYSGTDFELKWLPKGATQFQSHNFGTSSITFIDGLGRFASYRTFSYGENPITMYANEDGPIIVGFLTSTGFVTQSTGILSASCSNIWGKPFSDKSFAVFDIIDEPNRIWQIYGATSIEETTYTSQDWTWGSPDSNVNRNGTLVILDNTVGTQSFIYTTEVGLISGPTNSGFIYNTFNSGNRTGISDEYQLILRSVPGETYVQGFHLVSKAGLSSFVDCFPGLSPSSNYNLDSAMIGKELITLNFNDVVGNRVQNYKISDLSLIDDYDPGKYESISLYRDRCQIYEQNGTDYTFMFIGAKGKQTITLQANSLNTEANDIQDNN